MARLAQRDIPRIALTDFTPPFHLHASRRRGGNPYRVLATPTPRTRVRHPYEATPPITKITPVADLVFCADSRWRTRGRRDAGRKGAGEIEGGEQGAAREGPGRDVSNERVAAGFENHGIIRQIKLERLRPFFHSHIPDRWNGLSRAYRRRHCRWSLLIIDWFMTSGLSQPREV